MIRNYGHHLRVYMSLPRFKDSDYTGVTDVPHDITCERIAAGTGEMCTNYGAYSANNRTPRTRKKGHGPG